MRAVIQRSMVEDLKLNPLVFTLEYFSIGDGRYFLDLQIIDRILSAGLLILRRQTGTL